MQLSEEQAQRLTRIGWKSSDALSAALSARKDPAPPQLARIIAQHRSGYRVHDGSTEFAVQAPARMIRKGTQASERPVVGDWILLESAEVSPEPMIGTLLPRRTALVRGAAGESHTQQFIAANVDYVLIVAGLDGDFNPRRLERYLVLTEGSGAQPVLVLTKADECADAAARLAEVQRLAGPLIMVHAINAKDPLSVAQLAGYFRPGDSAVLVGSSGAGKSTLSNTLLCAEKQKTSAVRGHDSRGRHTTTHRALLQLASGGCIIDTPGMRELKLSGEEDLSIGYFADIEALTGQCRFADCSHGSEPGCAVSAALQSGEVDSERYASYLKLRDELDRAGETLLAQLERKAHGRVMGKALNKRLAEKYGRR